MTKLIHVYGDENTHTQAVRKKCQMPLLQDEIQKSGFHQQHSPKDLRFVRLEMFIC